MLLARRLQDVSQRLVKGKRKAVGSVEAVFAEVALSRRIGAAGSCPIHADGSPDVAPALVLRRTRSRRRMRQQRGVRRPAAFPEGRQPKREQKHLHQQTKVGSQPQTFALGERGEGAGEARASRVVVGGVRGSVRAATSKGVHKHWKLGLGVVAVASLVVGHSSKLSPVAFISRRHWPTSWRCRGGPPEPWRLCQEGCDAHGTQASCASS